MTHNTEVEDVAKELRMVANMINMGEKIRWGQETTLMDEAADALEALHHQLQKAQEVWFKKGYEDAESVHKDELQKARQDWLRKEIVKLEGMKKDSGITEEQCHVCGYYCTGKGGFGCIDKRSQHIEELAYNQALQTIIDRFQAELDQDKK